MQAGIAGRLSTNLFVSGEGQCAAYTHIQSALESRQVLKRICEICESIQVPMSSLHRPMDQKFLVILVVRHQRLYQNLARDSRGSPALPATKQKSRKNAKHVSRFRLLPCTWTVMHICSLYGYMCKYLYMSPCYHSQYPDTRLRHLSHELPNNSLVDS